MDGPGIRTVDAAALAGRPLRHFNYVMAAFVTVLLLPNVIGAGKIAAVPLAGGGEWAFGAAILTPATYAVVGWLKRREGLDVYDRGTDFTPFRAKV